MRKEGLGFGSYDYPLFRVLKNGSIYLDLSTPIIFHPINPVIRILRVKAEWNHGHTLFYCLTISNRLSIIKWNGVSWEEKLVETPLIEKISVSYEGIYIIYEERLFVYYLGFRTEVSGPFQEVDSERLIETCSSNTTTFFITENGEAIEPRTMGVVARGVVEISSSNDDLFIIQDNGDVRRYNPRRMLWYNEPIHRVDPAKKSRLIKSCLVI